MGLGDRGKNKVKEAAAPELFRKTEPLTDVHNNIDTKKYISAKPDIHKPVSEKNDQRKLFNFSFSLSERLRKCAYETRRKEMAQEAGILKKREESLFSKRRTAIADTPADLWGKGVLL